MEQQMHSRRERGEETPWIFTARNEALIPCEKWRERDTSPGARLHVIYGQEQPLAWRLQEDCYNNLHSKIMPNLAYNLGAN
jgi:hypothetical protein